MKKDIAGSILEKLEDQRGRRVVFLSHCLLNENTRYQGGAFNSGASVNLAGELLHKGFGIVQMPCPEQFAWGGVTKKIMRFTYGLDQSRSPLRFFKGLLVSLFIDYSRIVYRRMARSVYRQIRDYRQNGYEVAGIYGLDGSPTCGVNGSIDLKRGIRYHAALPAGGIDRFSYNRDLYKYNRKNGPGLFMRELDRLLKKNRVEIPWAVLDLEKQF